MGDKTTSENNHFDLKRLYEHVQLCKQEDQTILMVPYTDVFDELCRFFHMLGTVFGFVSSDVKDKVRILRHHLASEHSSHYASVQAMITHEVSNNTTVVKCKRSEPSGCRTLLRLHRAFEFVMLFLQKLHDNEDHYANKVSHMAQEAYHSTLANHHPWLIRKTASMAMLMAPSRHDLMMKMCSNMEEKAALELLAQTIQATQPIYDTVQSLYVDNGLQDLP